MRAMLRRALVVVGSVALLTLANTLAEASPPAKAAEPAKPAQKTQGGTAPEGEACKADADCAQNQRPLACVKSKCTLDVQKIPPPT
jgi:hypothetical protein